MKKRYRQPGVANSNPINARDRINPELRCRICIILFSIALLIGPGYMVIDIIVALAGIDWITRMAYMLTDLRDCLLAKLRTGRAYIERINSLEWELFYLLYLFPLFWIIYGFLGQTAWSSW